MAKSTRIPALPRETVHCIEKISQWMEKPMHLHLVAYKATRKEVAQDGLTLPCEINPKSRKEVAVIEAAPWFAGWKLEKEDWNGEGKVYFQLLPVTREELASEGTPPGWGNVSWEESRLFPSVKAARAWANKELAIQTFFPEDIWEVVVWTEELGKAIALMAVFSENEGPRGYALLALTLPGGIKFSRKSLTRLYNNGAKVCHGRAKY